jgi:uncharacterized protein (DUF433 family)
MTPSLAVEPVPLQVDADGVLRVGGTRVPLDTIVAAFQEGVSAEGTAEQYPSVSLADVYAVLGYYLHRRTDVESYLEERRLLGTEIRLQNEARSGPAGDLRSRLFARRQL